ncbi:glycosyltransferase family 2 protein [Promicromonospora sp. MS192]|uniref:glycosyltransferase family 2 protein n=1 Tax=Promicromonospora sp. MS192 TaxID=3412684 RepID=UPI003C2F4698
MTQPTKSIPGRSDPVTSSVGAGGEAWRELEGQADWEFAAGRVGLTVRNPGADWRSILLPATVQELVLAGREVRLSALVAGAAIAAGFSLGGGRDYLVPLDKREWPRRLTVEISERGKKVVFLVDGRISTGWTGAPDLPMADGLAGIALRTLGVAHVEFSEIEISTFDEPCELSVVIACHRFGQRLRVALNSWVRQDAPTGSYEIIVVNPGNPDGTSEMLASFAASFPEVRLRELSIDGPPDKPVLINRAVEMSRGHVVWLADSDCLFPTGAVRTVLDVLHGDGDEEFLNFAERRHLGRSATDALLGGSLDPVRDFSALLNSATGRDPQRYPWGYSQIVSRRVLLETPYREEVSRFAHSDGIFVDECRRRGIPPRLVDGLICLHLDHPFAWYGTSSFL